MSKIHFQNHEELYFTHSNGNKVKLTTPDTLGADKTFKLPNSDGSSIIWSQMVVVHWALFSRE